MRSEISSSLWSDIGATHAHVDPFESDSRVAQVVAGNLIVGRYQADFLPSAMLDFEAILLFHHSMVVVYAVLYPRDCPASVASSDHQAQCGISRERKRFGYTTGYVFHFLSKNYDMIRLRNTQLSFFEEFSGQDDDAAEDMAGTTMVQVKDAEGVVDCRV
jgi:hypothetical protein